MLKIQLGAELMFNTQNSALRECFQSQNQTNGELVLGFIFSLGISEV